ncbi:MAG: hypothetical protein FGM15_12565 [Chthoniobacterales bacterium]|nr:hypothetical protein [Chthoniobacterales bacterium]
MTIFPTLAASLPAAPTFVENLQYQVTGMLVVLVTLGGMALVVWIAGKFFAVRDRSQRAREEEAAAEISVTGPIHAVIAAAVATALEDKQFVIYGIRTADPSSSLAWSAEGRRSIYATRNIR